MLRNIMLAAAIVLAGAGGAVAANIITTPLLTGIADGGYNCSVLNVSSSRVKVKVAILPSGQDTEETELEPGDDLGVAALSQQGSQEYCRVTTRGSKTALRLSFEARTGVIPFDQTFAVVQGQ